MDSNGIEIFSENGSIWAVKDGLKIKFEELPSVRKRVLFNEFSKDKEFQAHAKKVLGIAGVESQFKHWIKCKSGIKESK